MSGDNFLSEMLSKNSSVWVYGIKKLTTTYKTFNNYYNHEKYAEYVPMAIVMFFLSNFMLFDDVTIINHGFLKSIPDLILLSYCAVYYNINSWIGRSMTKFLLLIRFASIILSFILPYYKVISLLNFVLSLLFLTVGYHKLTDKNYKQLVELRHHVLYLAPFHAYIFYEKNYRLEKNICKCIDIVLNYIKTFSTSDIIKQYNSCHKINNSISQNNTDKKDEVTDEIAQKNSINDEEKEDNHCKEEISDNNQEKIDNDSQEENTYDDITENNRQVKRSSKEIVTEYEGIQTRSKTNKKED